MFALLLFKPVFVVLVFAQIRSLVTDLPGEKLLVLSGQSPEQGGGVLLQGGSLTWQHFHHVVSDPQVSSMCRAGGFTILLVWGFPNLPLQLRQLLSFLGG